MRPAKRHQMKKTCRSFISLGLLALTIWFCGCSGVSVKGTWQDGAPRNQPYATLLVIGVSPDRDLRCAFESTFASQLMSASTTVISSGAKMSAKEPLTRENVERVAASATYLSVVFPLGMADPCARQHGGPVAAGRAARCGRVASVKDHPRHRRHAKRDEAISAANA